MTNTVELTPLQLEQLSRIETVLTNMGCSYAIRLPDGEMLGDLDALVGKHAKRGPMQFPRGTVRNYFRPMVDPLLEGQSVLVPFDKFNPESLQSNIASYCTEVWGSKTYITTLRKELNAVEVLRTGGI